MPEIEFEKYKTAGAYHWSQISRNPRRRNSFVLARYLNMIKLLEQATEKSSNRKVLDLGCGDGVLAYFVAEKGYEAFGVDPSELAIQFANQRASKLVNFSVGNAYDLKFEDGFFDYCISSDVIEHVNDPVQLMTELKRVTRSGGKVILSTPIKLTEKPLDPMHVVEWFPEEFKALTAQVFSEVEFHYSHPVALMEISAYHILNKPIPKYLMNLLSLIKNPFEGFESDFRYMALQYAVCRV